MNDVHIDARFSPGPWWGYNGVDRLELSGEVFTRTRYRLLRGNVPMAFALNSIEFVSQEVQRDKRSGQPKWVRMTLLIHGAKKTFTGHVDDGKPFAEALSKATAQSRKER